MHDEPDHRDNGAWRSFKRTMVWARAPIGDEPPPTPLQMAAQILAAILVPLVMVLTILAIAWLAAQL